MTRASGSDGGLGVLVPGGLFALALVVRALPWRTVLAADGVHLAGHDAWYHLRRIAWSIANPSRALDFDPFLHFPEGARPIWSPAFDAALAAVIGLWVAPGDTEALERSAVWVPPLLGALTVVTLYWVARRHLGGVVAGVAGLCVALLPAHFWYARIGYVDHHVAVALTAVLGLGAALALVRAAEPGGVRASASAAWLGAAMAIQLLVWPGSLLHVAALEAALLAHAATRATGEQAGAAARRFAIGHLLAFALVLPFCLGNAWPQWGTFTPLVLSAFQPWWLGAMALASAVAAVLWSRTGAGRGAGIRFATGAGLAGAILGTSLVLWPSLGAGAADALAWLLRDEVFQARVFESQPLLSSSGRFDASVAIGRLSPFVFVVPLVVPWLWMRSIGREQGDRVRLVLAWSAVLFVATLLQRRFFHSFALGEALLIGCCWVEAEGSLRARFGAGRDRAIRAALSVGLALLLLPALLTYRIYLVPSVPGEPLRVSPGVAQRRVTESMALWLRENTPQVSGWLEPDAAPEYGVLAPWEAGHAIQYLARRPTVVDNFGDDLGPEGLARSGRYFASAEPEALAILEALRVRYVVTGPGAMPAGPPGPESMLRALRVRDGAALPSRGPDASGVPALERHRLVWESGPRLPGDRGAAPLYKVFEVVDGARILGRARPGAILALDLALRTERGRDTGYRATARADASGSFSFRVPHAAPGRRGAVQALGPYRLRCADEVIEVRVDEASVLTGASVHVAPRCGGADVEAEALLPRDRGL